MKSTTTHTIDAVNVYTHTARCGFAHKVTCRIGAEKFAGEFLIARDGKEWIAMQGDLELSIGEPTTKAKAVAAVAAYYLETLTADQVKCWAR